MVPEDFNLDVETTGNIKGVNPGDTKLVAMRVHLASSSGTVTARRIKADHCSLAGTGVEILSSLEVANLQLQAGELGVLVKKRIGVNESASINSKGPIKIGSCFSLMAHLPEPSVTSNLSIDSFSEMVRSSKAASSQMTSINCDSHVKVDNLQGVVAIRAGQATNIDLMTVESAKLFVTAPQSAVTVHLRSLHDDSVVHCSTAEIVVNEHFGKCRIYD